jgi:hypothetical protein
MLLETACSVFSHGTTNVMDIHKGRSITNVVDIHKGRSTTQATYYESMLILSGFVFCKQLMKKFLGISHN